MANENKDKVGEGAFGLVLRTVYEEYDAMVKVPRLGDFFASHFLHEAQVLRYLDGAGGAPRLLHLGPPEDPRIFMTSAGSTTLQHLLDEEALDEQGVVQTVLSVALRVQEVHAKGVVHNDLKADNVMVSAACDQSGLHQVNLIDFGLSTFTREVERPQFELHESYGDCSVMFEEGDPANDVVDLGSMLKEALDEVCFLGSEEALGGALATLMEAMMRESASDRPDIGEVILSLQFLVGRGKS
ncbi:mitogen-activated protein kinase HOG1B-like [Portunus trituberculatus]|uniref:Mitogen-activated protein kinase HOG1A n=1 Tax=Portunus trituberculatus TaxID=210409 RepID=A0A5B7IK25_PORTR|nr:mitogen-activated protein kinase HOG1B-like [Portunus trituberculatus]MPC84880.1 Mitogen-activated protein kinase HOG1A [Portunus trituberculatus]